MEGQTENLCADAGYAGETPQVAMVAAGYTPHVRPRGEERREKIVNPLLWLGGGLLRLATLGSTAFASW